MPDIRFAQSDADIVATFPLMKQLRLALEAPDYLNLVRRLQGEHGYLLASAVAGERLVAVAGFRLMASLAWGKYVYVDDLVCDESLRSQGYGGRLLAWIAEFARTRGCTQLHLDSGVQRFDAHRFYLRERMAVTCHHFGRML